MRIKKLDPKIYRKIAAGEVVERPSSVVKELVENSIDAGADEIIVDVEKGGIAKIKVTDNGCGIEIEDMPLVFEHHATSKIEDEEDLWDIQTMGFRGEALSSISSVAKVRLISRVGDSPNGYFYAVSGGEFFDKGTKAFQKGSSIEVRDLFFNVPARKKFLKTPATEFLHITRVFTNLCLANKSVSFKLIHNGKEIYSIRKVSNFSNRIKQLFGKNILDGAVPIFCGHPHIKISGFIGKPQTAYDSKSKQFIFVNGRPVRDRIISSSVRASFGSLIMHSATPLYFVNVSVPFDFVDVNTHPRKEEVKFKNPNLIYSLVKSSVSESLSKKDLSFSPSGNLGESVGEKANVLGYNQSEFRYTGVYRKQPSVSETLEFYSKLGGEDNLDVLVFNNLYLVAIADDGLELYDQHALHERILYEKFKKAFLSEKPSSQILLTAQSLEFSEEDFQVIMANIRVFKRVGFDIAPSGVRTLKINAVPSFLNKDFSTIMTMFKEFVEDLKDKKALKDLSSMEEKALSSMACRAAVKAGDKLSAEEASNLVTKARALRSIYTCPHGRPFKIKISSKDLEKMFKRV